MARGRYIIGTVTSGSGRSDPGLLARVTETVRVDPQSELLEVQGSSEVPTLLVVSMTSERADELRREFGDHLLVERDAPIYPL